MKKCFQFFLPKFTQIKFSPNPIGAYSLISLGANSADMELGARLALTYTKFEPGKIYEAAIEEAKFSVTPFDDKNVAQEYFVGR